MITLFKIYFNIFLFNLLLLHFNVVTCPSGWISRTNKCYFVSDEDALKENGSLEGVKFRVAVDQCKRMDATLLEMDSQAENKFIQAHMKDLSMKTDVDSIYLQQNRQYWIGIYYNCRFIYFYQKSIQ